MEYRSTKALSPERWFVEQSCEWEVLKRNLKVSDSSLIQLPANRGATSNQALRCLGASEWCSTGCNRWCQPCGHGRWRQSPDRVI